MNKNDLKETHSQYEPEGAHLPPKTAISLKTALVFWGLQKNMRYEFLGINVLGISLFILITLTDLYYSPFYIFYKSISEYDLNVEDCIRKLAHELELNIEIYINHIIFALLHWPYWLLFK
jgi:hypothetical protein